MIRTSLAKSSNATPSSHLLTLIAVVVVIAGLYFGRQVLIPLSLAVVLAFLFSPIVDLLQRFRLGRVPSVLIVLLLAFSLLGSVGWVVAGQLVDIVDQIPSYRSNIHEKIQALRVPSNSRFKSATNTVSELQAELSSASQLEQDKKTTTTHGRPIAVQVSQPPSNAPEYLRAIVGPLTGIFEMSAMVIVFMLFILIKREDLRNRVIRLAGEDQLTVVTQALDDASQRLSRYLLFQFVVNTAYGVMFGISVSLLRLPHPLLWGVLSGLLRFVPYVGTPIAAAFPVAMALAVFPGWHQAIFVFCIFVGLELVTANLVEPWLYGAHTGISSLAILVAAVFWATLWGPVGLILSTPLTVCLILMGRYVPQLTFLEVLLGDEPVLPVEAHFYQRLLALDEEEARDIAEVYLKEKPIGSFYDSVLIPALALAEQDRHVDSLEARTASFVNQSARELIDELGERNSVGQGAEELVLFHGAESDGQEPKYDALRGTSIVCIPAGDEADELVAMMAEQLLQRLGCEVQRLPIASSANVIDPIATYSPQVALVSALPPFASWQARALCKLLRRRHPQIRILLGLWHFEGGVAKAQDRVGLGCADMVAISLEQAIALLAEAQGSRAEDTSIHVERTTATGSGDALVEGFAKREVGSPARQPSLLSGN